MIDLDQLDDQLESALAQNVRAAPERRTAVRRRPVRPHHPLDPEPALDLAVAQGEASEVGSPASADDTEGRIAELMRAGRVAEADLLLAAHAEMARRDGSPLDRRDAASWATMRALLDGRPDDARRASATVLRLGREGSDPEAWSRHLVPRFWLVLGWGGEDEHYELLDECRERAYTFGDASWRGALTLLLACLGRADEARRELDATLAEVEPLDNDGTWLDVVTNLADAANTLGDADRARSVQRLLARVPDQLVLCGQAWACKGSLARYRAGLAATTGARTRADAFFRAAVDAHRAAGARPLLARTLHQWGTYLAGHDDLLSRRCLQESTQLSDALGLGPVLRPSA